MAECPSMVMPWGYSHPPSQLNGRLCTHELCFPVGASRRFWCPGSPEPLESCQPDKIRQRYMFLISDTS